MELDELKTAWRTLDERVNASIALTQRVQLDLHLDRARASFRRLAWLPRVELAMNFVAAFLVGGFMAEHVREPRFFAPALVLQGAALVLMIVCARQLALLTSIDYSASVVVIQRQLAELYALRLRTSRWILISAPLVWVPLAIVSAKGLFDLDLYYGFGEVWIAAGLIAGLAAIVLALWVSARCAERFRRPFWRYVSDEFSGRNLAKAILAVRELAEFAED